MNTNTIINATELTKLTMVQLKDLAKVKGLKGYSSLKKNELITSTETEQEQTVVQEEAQETTPDINITILSLDELYNSEVAGIEKQIEFARRANITFPEKDHSRWSIQYLYNLLKGAEARAKRREEFRSAFSKDENGWYIASAKDGTCYAFNDSKAIVKVGDDPARFKEVSSLQEGFDTCWDMCRKIFGEAHKKGGKN